MLDIESVVKLTWLRYAYSTRYLLLLFKYIQFDNCYLGRDQTLDMTKLVLSNSLTDCGELCFKEKKLSRCRFIIGTTTGRYGLTYND